MSWDLCLARRAAGVGVVVCLLALVIVAATDAGGPWSLRLGMTAALAPVAGAIGALLATRRAESKGELAALAALGADPARAVLGAAIGGSAVGALGVALAASPLADLAALFPQPSTARWVVDGEGVRELTHGLHVLPGGALAFELPAVPVASFVQPPVGFTVLAIAAAAIACPAWVSSPRASFTRRWVVGALALLAAIVAFQAVATARAPALTLALAPTLLFADLMVARRNGRSARAPTE